MGIAAINPHATKSMPPVNSGEPTPTRGEQTEAQEDHMMASC